MGSWLSSEEGETFDEFCARGGMEAAQQLPSASRDLGSPSKLAASKQMPVTLLSRFLGSGKTSLMKHILENKEGLRVAVIMNEITEVNLDATALEGTKLLKQEEKLIEMSNGCICCTLREDLLLQLRELARSEHFDAVLIESSGIAEPMQVAETFFVNLHDGNGALQLEAPLDNCVTVMDASMMERHMESLETIEKLDPTADTNAEGEQDIAALLFAQLEFANVVLLNKMDLLVENGDASEEDDRSATETRLAAMVKKINPRAVVIGTEHSRVPLATILRTGNFTVDFARGVDNWMKDIQSGVTHVPETLEYGVSGFFWTSDKPFHPTRLYDWFNAYFSLRQLSQTTTGIPSRKNDDTQLEARRSRYGNLFRSKGFVWIAGVERGKWQCQWQQAGTIGTFMPLGLHFGEKPSQRLTFVGQHLKHDVLKNDLQKLLLNPADLLETDVLHDPFLPFPNSSDIMARLTTTSCGDD